MHALRLPRTIATCFAGSALSLYAVALGLQFRSVRISLGSLSGGLLIVVAWAFFAARIRSRAELERGFDGKPASTGVPIPFAGLGPWAIPYGLFWAIVVWRACHEPLAGPDVEFRWSFLAERMLRYGS